MALTEGEFRSDPDFHYENQLRARHRGDRVLHGMVGHGPCDVCFLIARLDRERGHSEDTTDVLYAVMEAARTEWTPTEADPMRMENER